MSRTILGARIRERRRGLGITQAALARRIGISPSYLNLIEHNKRGIAGTLLRNTAAALDLELEELDGAAERRLLATLEELAHTPDIASLGAEVTRSGELIGRFPGWSRAIAALAHSEGEATETARALADRLSHDPFLGEAMHRILTRVAALRSAAEILVDHPDIDPVARSRFHHILREESCALTDAGEALASYFNKADATERVLTPLDEVEALFEARENHFDEVESAAANLADAMAPAQLAAPPQSRQQRARTLVEQHLGEQLALIVDSAPQVETVMAKMQAHEALLSYATDAVLAPMAAFATAARRWRYDVETLAETFGIGVETVCHRLSALPSGEDIPRFGYFRANAAGTIIETRALPGLVAPRHASACPLWVLYRAQQSPEAMLRQRTLFPSGARFVFLARARNTGPTGFGKPRHYLTDMLVMSEDDAVHTVYFPDPAVPVEPVGSACRSCPRRDCEHRVADPLAG